MSNLLQTPGQHVLQEATQEHEHRQCHLPIPRLTAATVLERYLTVFHREDAVVGDGRSKDIPTEMLQRGDSITDRFDITDELTSKVSSIRECRRRPLRSNSIRNSCDSRFTGTKKPNRVDLH